MVCSKAVGSLRAGWQRLRYGFAVVPGGSRAGGGALVLGACRGYCVRRERAASFDDRLRGCRGWLDRRVDPGGPGALSQGHTRQEARENVIDALHGILELRFGEHALSEPASDSEPLELMIAA
jgi:predicted RNase H-like HicB family nuclease